MALATLSIDLVAKTAGIEQDMGRAAQVSEQTAARIDKSVGTIEKAIAGLGIAAFVSHQIDGLREAIDKLDALDDLSEKTGIAASSLSALSYASEVAGTSNESFNKGLAILAKNMAAAATGNTTQVATFKALNVEYQNGDKTLRSTSDVLLDIADRFAGYSDGAAKSALAQKAFRGEGEAMIPLLDKGRVGIKELTDEAQRFGLVVSDDAAKAAGDFNDNIKRIELAGKSFKLGLAEYYIEPLVILSTTFVKAREEGGLLHGLLVTIGQVVAGGLGLDEVGQLTTKAKVTADEIERTTNILIGLSNVIAKDPGNELAVRRYANLSAKLKTLQADAADTSTKLKDLANATDAANKPPKGPDKKDPDLPDPKGLSAAEALAKRTAKAYDDIIAKLKEKNGLAQVEIDTGQKATAADQVRLDVKKLLDNAEYAFSPQQKAAILALSDQTQATVKLSERTKERIQLMEQDAKATAVRLSSIYDENKALQEQYEEIGLTIDQVELLRLARLDHNKAIQEEKLATMELFGADADQLAQQRQIVDELQKGIDVRRKSRDANKQIDTDPLVGAGKGVQDYLKTVEDAGKASRDAVTSVLGTLEDDLTAGLKTGHINVKNTVDQLISEFLRLAVVRPLLQSLLGGSTTGGGSLIATGLAGLFGGKQNAVGNVYDHAEFKPFAAGGIFDSPKFFKFANGGAPALGVLGEAGPEAIMPLKRGSDGKLGVVAGKGGSGSTVNVYQSIAAGVSRGELSTILQNYGRQIKADILQSQRDRGAFSRGY